VQTFGDQFLAGAALADHQHRTVKRRRLARTFDRILKGDRLADELRFAFHSQSLAKFPADWQVILCGWGVSV
jgi:hypothetical protein